MAIVFLWATCAAHGLEFETQDIPLAGDQKIAFMPYVSAAAGAAELLVVETPDVDARQRQLQGLHDEPVRTVTVFRRSGANWDLRFKKALDASMDLVDTLRGADGVRLAGYQNSYVFLLNEESRRFEPLMPSGSMFVGANWDSSPTIEMFRDLNNDELDDFLMPGFDGWQVALQTEKGLSRPQVIGPPPEMNFGETVQFVGYRAQTPYLLDENQDGLNDIAFWVNGRFETYLQESSGKFASAARIMDPDQKDLLGGFFSVSLGEGSNEQSDYQRVLDGVDDINGDGLADLIIQRLEGEGIFGLETRYEIHLGGVGATGRLNFEPSASSVIATGGVQLSNERADLTGDGRQEFVVTSVGINIATMIRVLITRSASVDVSIYQMEDDSFSQKPRLKKEITVRFDFSKGELFVPAVLSAEVTGDGRKDLLVQKDLDTLLVYPGEEGPKLFARSAIKLELSLPNEREGFVVTDLNQDGRDELVLHVEREASSVLSVVEFTD